MANTDNFTPDGSSTAAGTGPAGVLTAATNPSLARLVNSGLAQGAIPAANDLAGRVFNFNFQAANGTPLNPEYDWRVRISMQPQTAGMFYNNPTNPIMEPLSATKGVIFPYTPSVTVSHTARYGETALTHSNYKSYFYDGSEVSAITIAGEFTVQNLEEGQYLMAVVQFLRACTKMFFGASNLAGTPPPMVFLDGYGPAYLPHVPCVVTSFQHTMPADVDYIKVPIGVALDNIAGNKINTSLQGVNTRLPTMSTITVTLQPVYSRTNIANNFTLEKFSSGGLIQDGTGPVGGFI
jgi:hypothetical protein